MISHIENFIDARKILIKFIFLFFGSLIELDAVILRYAINILMIMS